MGILYKNKLSTISPEPVNPFFSNLLQVEKDNIESLAISWLEERSNQLKIKK